MIDHGPHSANANDWRLDLLRWSGMVLGLAMFVVGLYGAGVLCLEAFGGRSVYAEMLLEVYAAQSPLDAVIPVVALNLVALLFAAAFALGPPLYRASRDLDSKPDAKSSRRIVRESSVTILILLSGIIFESPLQTLGFWQLPVALAFSIMVYWGLKTVVFSSWPAQSAEQSPA
jgi:hypothetical protein